MVKWAMTSVLLLIVAGITLASPPAEGVALGTVTQFSGKATGIGRGTEEAGIVIVGKFTTDPTASVDCTPPATAMLLAVILDGGADIVPLPAHLDVTGRSATVCIFENLAGGGNDPPPFVRLLVRKLAPGVFNFRLEVTQATRAAIVGACPIALTTSFDLPGVVPPGLISVSHQQPWNCFGTGNRYLRTP